MNVDPIVELIIWAVVTLSGVASVLVTVVDAWRRRRDSRDRAQIARWVANQDEAARIAATHRVVTPRRWQ